MLIEEEGASPNHFVIMIVTELEEGEKQGKLLLAQGHPLLVALGDQA